MAKGMQGSGKEADQAVSSFGQPHTFLAHTQTEWAMAMAKARRH